MRCYGMFKSKRNGRIVRKSYKSKKAFNRAKRGLAKIGIKLMQTGWSSY
jgi:hypothetical protein